MNKEKKCLLIVKIKPRADANKIIGWKNGVLIIKIKAAPEKNKANKKLIKFLSRELNMPQTNITISRGSTSSKKTISLSNCSENDIKDKLDKK